MDVKTNTGLVVSVEAIKKPENANKVQELAAMEEALKKATDLLALYSDRFTQEHEKDYPFVECVTLPDDNKRAGGGW